MALFSNWQQSKSDPVCDYDGDRTAEQRLLCLGKGCEDYGRLPIRSSRSLSEQQDAGTGVPAERQHLPEVCIEGNDHSVVHCRCRHDAFIRLTQESQLGDVDTVVASPGEQASDTLRECLIDE